MVNVFGKVPAYTTIGYWTQELGLSVYKKSCSLFKDKRYTLIVDEGMMIGSEKLLLTLAMAKTEHSHPLGMVVSTHFRCGKGVKRGLKNGALPFNID